MHTLSLVFAVLWSASVLSDPDPQDIHLHIHSDDVVQNEHEHYNEKEHKHAVQTQTQTQSQTQTQKGSNMPTPVKTGSGYAQKQTYLTKKTGTGVYTQKQAYLAKNNGLHAVQTQTQQGSNRPTPVKTGSGYAKKQTYSAKKNGTGHTQKQTYSHTEVERCQFSPECPRRSPYENPLCNLGRCTAIGDIIETQCDKYTDCPCKSKPRNCFCIQGRCTRQRWECHNSTDCKKMAKCKGKQCICGDGCHPEDPEEGTCELRDPLCNLPKSVSLASIRKG